MNRGRSVAAGVRYRSLPWRLAGALLILFVGYLVVTRALAMTVASNDLTAAHALAPENTRIAAALAREVLNSDPLDPLNRREAAALATQALSRDATTVEAMGVLGLTAQLRGDVAGSRRWFRHADQLSRRDMPTELWLIEDAVGRGSVSEALHHYDVALRTQLGAGEILFPILSGAAAQPAIANELAKTLARRPLWLTDFLNYVAERGQDSASAVQLFERLRALGVSPPSRAQAVLVNMMLRRGERVAAWAYYVSTHPGADRRRSRDPYFSMQTEASQFDWIAADDPGVSATLQPDADRGVFSFAVAPTVGGPLLEQLQLLPTGDYLLEGHSNRVEQPAGRAPYWELKCAQSGRVLGRVAVTGSSRNGGKFAGRFTVPAECLSQILTLIAPPSDAVDGLSGEIDYVQLRPAS